MIVFTSCDHNQKIVTNTNPLCENSKFVMLKLSDSLGIVTFSIPNRYDTFFQWTDWSDCGKPCATVEYRYQSKKNPIFLETGFMYKDLTDSIDQFTIAHSADLYYSDGSRGRGTLARTLLIHKFEMDDFKNRSEYQVKFDTVEKMDDRYFSIVIYQKYDTLKSQYLKCASAGTTIKNNCISFCYTLLTKQNDSVTKTFIDNAKKLLHTIKISNGI